MLDLDFLLDFGVVFCFFDEEGVVDLEFDFFGVTEEELFADLVFLVGVKWLDSR